MPKRKTKAIKKIKRAPPGRPAAPRKIARSKSARSKPPASKPAPISQPSAATFTQEYREYLERYRMKGKGRLRLSPVDFEKCDNELIDLLTIQADIGALPDEGIVRLQELEYLLLDGES
ncbi:MAG: hypothetical protein HY327_06540 [Chloroflexi bacterium]|nr:hypothetical protein [Chloroflexota bacterium]